MNISCPVLTPEQLTLYQQIQELQNLLSGGMLSSSELVALNTMKKSQKKKLVYEIHFKNKKRKEFYYCKDGRIKSYNPQYIAQSEDELIDKLYDHYFGFTLEAVFKKWLFRRQELELVSKKTLEEDVGIWKRNLTDTPLAAMPIVNIQPKDLLLLFQKWTGNGKITYKEFGGRKRVLNGIFKYSVFEGIRATNPLSDLPCNELKFKVSPPKTKVYSLDERNRLLAYLETIEQDAYTLAIQLSFYSILRIGEIKALRWEEHDLNRIMIENQLVPERTMNEDLTFNQRTFVERTPKGNPYFSIRSETINEKGVQVLYKMKSLNPHGKYLFMYQNRPLTTDTFNRRLRKYCSELGITYHSSHGIRFTSASLCHSKGMPDTSIQPLLGHSTLRMTQHYLRPITDPESEVQMQDILS